MKGKRGVTLAIAVAAVAFLALSVARCTSVHAQDETEPEQAQAEAVQEEAPIELTERQQEAIAAYPPPANKGKYVKIKYITMLKDAVVPTFIFFCNLPQWVKEPYRRYLENKIRENWDFCGTPINVLMREK